jgi:hypothetical protein
MGFHLDDMFDRFPFLPKAAAGCASLTMARFIVQFAPLCVPTSRRVGLLI